MPQSPLFAATATAGGVAKSLTVDAQGAQIVTQRHGALYSPALAGVMGYAANQSGATLSAGLATTYTGLCLSNPAASGKNLALGRVSGQINVAPAALTAFGLIVGFAAGGITVHTTPVTPKNGILSATPPALVGLADAACTLVGTPVWQDWISELTSATGSLSFTRDYSGSLIIPPGGYVAIGASIAGPTAGLLAGISWEEVAI